MKVHLFSMDYKMNIRTDNKFIYYLRWLKDEKGFNGCNIIAVCEKPYNYDDMWLEFNVKEYK